MTIEELKANKNYKEYTSAWMRGYVSRKSDGYVRQYEGRYGKGYVWIHPSWESTQYCRITYFIEK